MSGARPVRSSSAAAISSPLSPLSSALTRPLQGAPARRPPRALLRLRRHGRRALLWLSRAASPLALALATYLLGRGSLRWLLAPGVAERERLGPALAFFLLVVLLCVKAAQRLHMLPQLDPLVGDEGLRGAPTSDALTQPLSAARCALPSRALWDELEAGGALVLCTFFTLQALGGSRSPLHPLVYALAAFLTSLHSLQVALPLLGLLLGCEALLLHADGALLREPERLLVHGLFIGLFATLHAIFLKGQLLLMRRDHRRALGGEIERMHQEAGLFRLLGGSGGARSRAEAEVALTQGSVVMVHKSLAGLLSLVRHALGLHACALYFVAPDRERLLLKEATQAPGATPALRRTVAADAGALGMVVKRRALLNLGVPKDGHLAYYEAPPPVLQGFVGVPIVDAGREDDASLWAILVADRVDAPLRDEEIALLRGAAEQVLRLLQSERAFTAVERSQYEHERLYHASERLNRALTPEQVHETAFAAAREVVSFDFAALTSYDPQQGRHAVVALAGSPHLAVGAGPLLARAFPDNSGLCAMALKNRAVLPAGEAPPQEPLVFDEETRLSRVGSLLVLPLQCAGEPVGTLVFAAERPGVLGKDQREMLGVIANQVAVSLENARMYDAMKAMATTDGLTGLTNRRAFNERFDEMLQRARRQGKSLTLMMTDIDHFKRVNDSYGHPVGDVVLKRVAQVVQSCVRKIDMAARYGGEEFALVLEHTDREGARQLAERVRVEVSRLSFSSDKGPFQCTLSLGMATFPLDGDASTELLEHADQSLYHAKHSGRNRAVAYVDLERVSAALVDPLAAAVAEGARA